MVKRKYRKRGGRRKQRGGNSEVAQPIASGEKPPRFGSKSKYDFAELNKLLKAAVGRPKDFAIPTIFC